MTPATISILDLEEAAARGWRAPEDAALGRWRLRAADGFTVSAVPGRPGTIWAL